MLDRLLSFFWPLLTDVLEFKHELYASTVLIVIAFIQIIAGWKTQDIIGETVFFNQYECTNACHYRL